MISLPPQPAIQRNRDLTDQLDLGEGGMVWVKQQVVRQVDDGGGHGYGEAERVDEPVG